MIECHLEIPSKVRFWTDDTNHVDIDIVEGQMKVESIADNLDANFSTHEKNRDLCCQIQEWFQTEYSAALTMTQAWAVFTGIRVAYEQFKKKLGDDLRLPTGTAVSIPGNSPSPTSKNSSDNSQSDKPNENFKTAESEAP